MFNKIYSAGIWGIDGRIVSVEADSNNGLPGTSMVGCLSAEVREAQERVRTALRNSGFSLPPKKTVINLSPASIRKEGTTYDLAIALAVLSSLAGGSNLEAESALPPPERLRDWVFVGELGLDGSIKPVRGVLSIVLAAKSAGFSRCLVPEENLLEGLAVKGIQVLTAGNLRQCVEFLNSSERCRDYQEEAFQRQKKTRDAAEIGEERDFSEVNGQLLLKRAAEIGAAGRHNLLLIGAAGTGKTMVAKRIPSILPPMTEEEAIAVSRVYSIRGLLPAGEALLQKRPFRSPHHTASPQALAGGGSPPKPGELSLASKGVLFLDELPEFSSKAIEILRQPLEEHTITVSRAGGTCVFPADLMLVAAMNPCPCGFYPDRNKCRCSQGQIRHYLGKISRPILDRFDLCAEASPVRYRDLRGIGKNESSVQIRARVERAWEIQRNRFSGTTIRYNSQMSGAELERFCKISREEEDFLERVYLVKNLSARALHKILKVSRTIADLEGSPDILRDHLCEAIGYRTLEDRYWGGEDI